MGALEDTLSRIGALDQAAMRQARERQDRLTKPQGSLGRLEELSVQVAGIQATTRPDVSAKVIFVMAGDHGVVDERVSAYPQEVTAQMIRNFVEGGAAINVLARQEGARVVVVDMGVAADLRPHPGIVQRKVGRGTANLAHGPAMSREHAVRSVEAGIEVLEAELGRGCGIAGLGDMGIGNTTASAAIVAAFTGRPVATVTGRGTGVDDACYARKLAAIRSGLAANRPDPDDAMDVLAKVGGFEIGGLAGVALAAAAHRVPVVVDGFIAGAAALIAAQLEPKAREFLIAGHVSVEPGHHVVLQQLGLSPLLDLGMRLGEGTGAALAMGLIESAVKVLNEMATFEAAGVSEALGHGLPVSGHAATSEAPE
jgi:nicotinate-nucleotide--dimethylbenzimidazole phosphoribosyltransferase